MNLSSRLLAGLSLLGLAFAAACASTDTPPPDPSTEKRSLYSRCNLRVLKGNTITWVNWQSAPTFIPAGTALEVHGGPQQWYMRNDEGTIYTLDAGGNGDEYLFKFVSEEQFDPSPLPEDAQKSIQQAVARLGMTREQVYIAMGPPQKVDETDTVGLTFEQILVASRWVYRRKRFGKDIGVQFDRDGIVKNTEGIWR